MKSSLFLWVLIFMQYSPQIVGDDSCHVTLPESSPVAPPGETPESSNSSHAWYGSEALAAFIPRDGIWVGMGPEKNYRDKFWW